LWRRTDPQIGAIYLSPSWPPDEKFELSRWQRKLDLGRSGEPSVRFNGAAAKFLWLGVRPTAMEEDWNVEYRSFVVSEAKTDARRCKIELAGG
jgi:hypothetical protein